jgi:beta-lactamase class A
LLHSRRRFLAAGAAAVATAPLSALAAQKSGNADTSPDAILSVFKSLPGEVAVKIHAPATEGKPEFLVESNSSKQMFVGSAIKTFILCESPRQVDSPNVVQSLSAEQLSLDASVWNLDSVTFNPPNLIGKVSQRTALEAMIMHSDNTGTDMCIKHASPDKVRALIASAGLKNTMIPESTRVFFGYLLGAKNYQTSPGRTSEPLPISPSSIRL